MYLASEGVEPMKRTLYAALLALAVITTAQSQTAKQPPRSVETQPEKSVQTGRQRAAQAEMQKAQDACDEDRFADAEEHAKRASELDPSNKETLLFIAQVISRQYNRMGQGAEKTDKAREAIAAYQRVADADPGNDEAYYAISGLYGDINEDGLQYSWIMQRAINGGLSVGQRTGAYFALAEREQSCAREIVDRATDKLYVEETGKIDMQRLDDETRKEIAGGQQCVLRGIQMLEISIGLMPEDYLAWYCKSELLLSSARLYELVDDEAQADEYRAQAEAAFARGTELKVKQEKDEQERLVSVDCGALCDKVVSTPKPSYPAIARTARASGAVVVQITIDEEGNVSYASVVSGHPLLRANSVQAAKLSTFSPTREAGQPVKVNGTLTYNFTLP